MKDLIKETLSDLNDPVEFDQLSGAFKWGKHQIMIIYPDNSYKIYKLKINNKLKFSIKEKDYIIIPKCILRSRKKLFIAYYFNNPFPINFKWEGSKLTSKDLYTNDQLKEIDDQEIELLAKTVLDAASIHSLLSTNVVKGLYPKTGIKQIFWVVLAIVGFIMFLIILQLLGFIDLYSFIAGKPS